MTSEQNSAEMTTSKVYVVYNISEKLCSLDLKNYM